MENKGRVVSTNGKYAKVEVVRSSACGDKCGSCKGGCSKNATYINVENTAHAQPSEFVMLEIDTKTVMGAAFLTYILPLIMLIGGIIAGTAIYTNLSLGLPSEIFALLTGISFMIFSYFIVRFFDSRFKSQDKVKYHIAKII